MKGTLSFIAVAFLVLTLLVPASAPVGAQSAPQIALVDPAPPTARFGSGAPNVINATATSPGSTITSAQYQLIFNDPPGTFTALEIFAQVPIVPPDIAGAQNTGPDFTGQVPVGSAVLFVVFGQVTQKTSNFGGNPAITEWRIGSPPIAVYQTADTGLQGTPVVGTEVRVVANRKVAPGPIVAEVIAQRPGGNDPNPPPPTVENAFLFNGTIESVEQGAQSAGFSIGGTVWNVRDAAGLLVPFRIDDPNLTAAVDPGIGLGDGLNPVVTVEFGIPLPTDVVENVGLEVFAQVPAGVPATRHQNPTFHLAPAPLQVPDGSWRLFVVFGTVTALDAANGEWQIGQPPVFVYEAADGSTSVRQIFDPVPGQNRAIAVGDGVKIVANRTLGPGPIVAEVITGQDAGPQPEDPPTMEGAFLRNGTVTLETATTWTVGGVVFTVTDAAIDAGLGAGVGEDPNVTVEFAVSGPPPPDPDIWAPLTLNTATNVHNAVLTPAMVAADRAGTVFLRATDANQQVSTSFTNAILTAVATAAPAPPTGLRAVIASPTVVNVTWTDASTNEASFRVERAADNLFTNPQTFVVAANGAGFTDDTVPGGNAPFYRVFAVNGFGDSAPATAVQAATGPPGAPTGLGGVVVSATRIDLTWTDSADNESGFRIERSTDGTTFAPLDPAPGADATAFSDTTVSAGGTFFYRVVAFNGAGDSVASNVLETAVLAPATPSALSATIVSTTQVDLTWTNNSTNATEFRIMRSTDGTGFTLLATQTGANVTTYSNTELTPGDGFWYQVVAANVVGASAASAPAQVALTAPQVAPTLAGIAASPTQVNLTWTSAATNASGFRIERSADGAIFNTLDTVVGANVAAYSNTGLTLGDAFWYRVVGTNVFGDSPASSPVQVSLTVPPAASLNAGAVSSTQVRLTWTTAATNATGFRIERSIDGVNFATLTTVGANVTIYDDFGATPGGTFTYRVFAVNGVGDSAASNHRIVTTPLPQPQATATPVPPPQPQATPTPIPTPTPVPSTPTPTPLPPVTPVARVAGEATAIIRNGERVEIELEDKTAIRVAPGAFPDTVQVKARVVPEVELPKPPQGAVRKALEIEVFDDKAFKLGPTAIQQPIVIEIPLSADDLAAIGDDPNNVELHRYDDGMGVWVKLGSELDLAKKVVRAQLRHLSLFAVVVPAPVTQAQPTPTAEPPSAGGQVPGSSAWLVALVIGLGILLFGYRLLRGAREPIKKE